MLKINLDGIDRHRKRRATTAAVMVITIRVLLDLYKINL